MRKLTPVSSAFTALMVAEPAERQKS